MFVVATDTFAGSSGGPLYDAAFLWVGLATKGANDWDWTDGCARPVHTETSRELHQHASRVVRALCESGWPSARLCGLEPRCGDAVCSPNETADTCLVDCPRPLCGDGWCEWQERGVCAIDCNRDDEIPLSWPSSPDDYWRAHAPAVAPPFEAGGGCTFSASSPSSMPFACLAAALVWLRRRLSSERRSAR
jgi:hypothetical protein